MTICPTMPPLPLEFPRKPISEIDATYGNVY